MTLVEQLRIEISRAINTLRRRFANSADEAERDAILVLIDDLNESLAVLDQAALLTAAAILADATTTLEKAVASARTGPFDGYLAALEEHLNHLNTLSGAMHAREALAPAPEPAAGATAPMAARAPSRRAGVSRAGLEPPLAAKDFASLEDEYARYFAACRVRPGSEGNVAYYVKRLRQGQPVYEQVGADLGGIPWYFIGSIHGMECGFNFAGHLHNGDPLTARTTHVPAGRPAVGMPPFTWRESAVDALTMKGFHEIRDWSVPRMLYLLEKYNGFGYRMRRLASPYLWSFSNLYEKGKFVADGHFDPDAVSKQCGVALMLQGRDAGAEPCGTQPARRCAQEARAEMTAEEQAAALKQQAEVAKQQLELLKAQTALTTAQAQAPFAELQGIKAAVSGLTLPAGKQGTVKIAAGAQGTMLLRSKRALLELLDEVADELLGICPPETVLVTDAQLSQACEARFTLERLEAQATELDDAQREILGAPLPDTRAHGLLPIEVARAYGVGVALDTVNSLAKLLRTDRQLDVYSEDTEAALLLGHLLDSKAAGFVASPATLAGGAIGAANELQKALTKLAARIETAKEILGWIQTIAEDNARTLADGSGKPTLLPSDDIGILKAAVDGATSLLDGLRPARKPDAFWAQVAGQVLDQRLAGKHRLMLDVKGQTLQVTEARWWRSDRIVAAGEARVAYRVLDESGTVVKAGVILKASSARSVPIDGLEPVAWSAPPMARGRAWYERE